MARPRRSEEEILEVAMSIADESGLEALTVRALSERLGLQHGALYRYFPSKEAIEAALIDRLLGLGFESAEPADEPLAVLRNLAWSLRKVLGEHPNLIPPLLYGKGELPSVGRVAFAIVESLQRLGLEGPALARWERILETYVAGTIAFDFAAAPDHLGIRRQRLARLGVEALIAANATDADVARENEAAFRAGLETLLAELARQANSGSE